MKFPVSFFIALATYFVAIVSTEAQLLPTTTPGLSRTETWIAERVTSGEIADLGKQFPDESDRVLNPKFMVSLLTGALPVAKPTRNGVRIIGARFNEVLDLTNATIPCEVWLEHCQFDEKASFIGTTFAGLVSFENTVFRKEANFNQIKAGDATFQKAVFEERASFFAANIAHSFYMTEAQFRNREEPALFSELRAARVILDKAVFEGPVNFISANVAGDFEAQETLFKNQKGGATFNGLKVAGAAFFRYAVFDGTANFTLAEIDSNFEAEGAEFTNKEQGVYFYGMKVRKIASFEKAVFEGRVEFDAADIAANFEASGAEFRSATETVRLVMKCGMQGRFKGVTFAGPVLLEDSSFVDLVISDVNPGGASVPRLDLSRSSIKRHLSIQKTRIDHLTAQWLRVEGPADFTDLTVLRSADLSYGNFSTLDLSRSVWPKDTAAFHMQGLNYTYIRAAADESESHAALRKLADQATYTADVYRNLEAFFLRQGYNADANRVFIAGKQRERREYLHGPAAVGSWFLDKLVGYGRHPWRAGIPCAFFVILGCFLFSPAKMEPQTPTDAPRVYSRFWYSLGLFLPFVDLQSSKVWKPNSEARILRHYMRIHILLGWILIPILLAAISGLIK